MEHWSTTPIIRILGPGDETSLDDFLLRHVDSSMFLLGNSRAVGLVDRGERLEGTYAAAFEGERMVAVAAHYWSGNIVLQAPSHAAAVSHAAVRRSNRAVKGMIGPNEQVGQALLALGFESSPAQHDQVDKLYRLELGRLAVPSLLTSGGATARRIAAPDVDVMSRWRAAYAIETLHVEDTPTLHRDSREAVERYLDEGRMWLLEVGGEPVACTAFNTATREAVQVGGVWTPPQLRGRGYARAAVAASLLDAREEGASVGVLFTGTENSPAQKAYEALGFRHVGDYRLLLLKSGVRPAERSASSPSGRRTRQMFSN